MFITYVLQSESTGKIYIGSTKDFAKRIKRHNRELAFNKKSYTHKNKGPWRLVYKEEFETRKEANKREKQLKSYKGREFIKTKILISGR